MTEEEAEEMAKTIADTIAWIAAERMKVAHFQDKTSAIYSVCMAIDRQVVKEMRKEWWQVITKKDFKIWRACLKLTEPRDCYRLTMAFVKGLERKARAVKEEK